MITNPITNSSTSVLIVGAGPTGLMLACQLERYGISYRIIERNSGPTTQSRALAIQARSLELFAQMDIAQRAIGEGRQAKAVNYVVRGKLSERISLEGFGKSLTKFPYLLILEQSKTEQVLVDFLNQHGHLVEWQSEVISFVETSSDVSVTVKRSDGRLENIVADWLVGADGARSIVRHQLDIPFDGKTYPDSLFVLDCRADMPFREDEAYVAFSDRCFAALFPMTEGRCRVISMLPQELWAKEEITFDDVATDFAERMQMDVRLSDPKWLSVYHAHHRHATVFGQGRCFLAGDAAHIHSPVGGQGMNTGLQDAHNLAWKLALVIQGKGKLSLLETYSEERLPVAKNLVRTTDRAFSMTVNKNPLARSWIMFAAPKALALLLREKHLRRFAFTTISQTGIGYRKSSLSRSASLGAFPRHAPKPGERLPYIEFYKQGEKSNIQDKVKDTAFHLFLFQGSNAETELQILREIAQRFYGAIIVETIPLTPETKTLYQAFGIKVSGYYLIRPDMFVAYRSAIAETEHFEHYLGRFLNASKYTQTTSRNQVAASVSK